MIISDERGLKGASSATRALFDLKSLCAWMAWPPQMWAGTLFQAHLPHWKRFSKQQGTTTLIKIGPLEEMLAFSRSHHQVEQGLKGGSESIGQVTLTSISSQMFISSPSPNTHTSGHLWHCLFIQRTTWRNTIPSALLQPEKHSVIPLNYFVWTSWGVFHVLPNSSWCSGEELGWG